jgi:1-acyl-sn-glycerol-3-phosphate acyltransferase
MMKAIYGFETYGAENLPSGPALIVANHNSGALLESHGLLFLMHERSIKAFGLNHRALFRIPLIGTYFRKIGAVSATCEAAVEVLKNGNPLLIFPGGNRQAFRPISREHEATMGWGSGWAQIACEEQVPVVAVKFSGSHWANPIFFCSEKLSFLLGLPALMGVRYFPVSLAQLVFAAIISTLVTVVLGHEAWLLGAIGAYFGFVLTPLVPILPCPIRVRVYPALHFGKEYRNAHELEQKIKSQLNHADEPQGQRKPYPLNAIERFMYYNESPVVAYNSHLVIEFKGVLDRFTVLAVTQKWIETLPYLRTVLQRRFLGFGIQRYVYDRAWFTAKDIVTFQNSVDSHEVDRFCQRRFHLMFEPGVRLLFQFDQEKGRGRMIFSCHHSLFDGAGQAFAIEAWSRIFNGRDVPEELRSIKPFRFRSLLKKVGYRKSAVLLLRNLRPAPPRSITGAATLNGVSDEGHRNVVARTISVPDIARLDPVAIVIEALDETLRKNGDSEKPIFIYFPTGLRWALKIRDSLQNAVVTHQVFVKRESLLKPGWIERVHKKLSADPIASNEKFIFGALALTAVLPETILRKRFEALDRPGSPESATLLFVRAPIPKSLPLPDNWKDIKISARGTLLRSPSVGVVLTGQKGNQTLTIEWIQGLVPTEIIDAFQGQIEARMARLFNLLDKERHLQGRITVFAKNDLL